jgi:NAD(P)-dependent dehydrogenase (short-subunit alcohol dehydrogenase family)
MKTALVTGGSKGFGRALTLALIDRGWRVIVDARNRQELDDLALKASSRERLVAVAGDVGQPEHRASLRHVVETFGELHLLVNNASTLGPTPLPPIGHTSAAEFAAVLLVNTVAPVALCSELLPWISKSNGSVVNISSDAAMEHYEGWGLYGASKAALDHATLTLAAENPGVRWLAFDPGDMRTDMHQAAFPGEDISDRPDSATVVPLLLQVLDASPASGRYRATDVLTSAGEPK